MPLARAPLAPAALVAALALSATAGAQTAADSSSQIVVTASRTATVPAERATLIAVVEGAGDAASDASRRADATLLEVREAVRWLGDSATVLDAMPTVLAETPTASGFRHIPGRPTFRARYVVRIAVPHAADAARVATAALTAGARSVTPSYDAAALDSTRRATYAEALAQARQDAEAIAQAMGARLGPVIDVATAPPATTTDAPGAMSVGSTLTVRYRVVPAARR